MNHDINLAKIPITIGMIGHRNCLAEDIPLLKAAIEKVVREIQSTFPDTPLLCVTSLAEGADQIAFDVSRDIGLETLVILPMDYDDYILELKDNAEAFQNRWNHATRKYILPHSKEEKNNDNQYDIAAHLIASNVHYLIVLWDGQETNLVGGTSETVNHRLLPQLPKNQVLAKSLGYDHNILNFPGTGPLIHIHANREGQLRQKVAGTIEWHMPEWLDCNKDEFAKIIGDHNRMCRDVSKLDTLKSDGNDQLICASRFKSGENKQDIIGHYSTLDRLASKFKRLQLYCIQGLALFSLLTLAFYELYGNATEESLGVLISFYGVSLILAWGSFVIFFKCGWQDRFLDYRTLSEALKIQFFWKNFGLNLNAADYGFSEQDKHLAWIKFALRSAYLISLTEKTIAIDMNDIKERWIDRQIEYFSKASARENFYFTCLKIIGQVLLALSTLFLILHYAAVQTGYDPHTRYIILTVSVLLPTFAIVLGFFLEIMGYEEHVNQYQKMGIIYKNVQGIIPYLPSERNQDMVAALGRKALDENASWLILHRSRPIRVIS